MQIPSQEKPLPCVLLIEPEESIIDFISLGMKYEGYRVEGCQQYSEAVEFARKVRPQLIILDLDLPNNLGFDICRQLRSEQVTQHRPIIALTEIDSEQVRQDAQEVGANAFIVKPFDLDAMLNEVNSFIAYLNPFRLRPQRGFIIQGPYPPTDPLNS